ncbi:MAG TPA: phosphatase PAP2 family protein [Acidimicrobiales bacterium]
MAQQVWLEWEPAAMAVFVMVGLVIALRPLTQRWAVVGAAFARELAIMFTLYAVWRLANRLSLMQVDGAMWRGRWLWDLERSWHLPSEQAVQQMVLPHPLLVQIANVYYAVAHVPAMLIFLVWLFALHRPRYPKIRNALAITTGACLLFQLIPLAPPRLLPELGVLDTPLLYHQSVYGQIGTGIAAQLSAMPSVHVAWALLVGIGAVMVSSSRWRWLVLAHPALTVWVVVVTGNHFWLDGGAAAVILVLALLAQRWSPVESLRQRVIAGSTATTEGAPAASGEPAAALGERLDEPIGAERPG